jgi:5S rRNA maturation endonuclease (ribonuclease M5)
LDQRSAAYVRQLNRLASDRALPATMTDYFAAHAIDDPMVWEKYQLGLVTNPAPQDRRFKGMLVIPYLTLNGVKAFKFRCMEDHDHNSHVPAGKYAVPSGQAARIYNPAAYADAFNQIGVCEGEVDAIVATEAIGIPTIGIPGVEMWKGHINEWKHTLKDYDEIIVFSDGDEAGRRMARQIQEDLGTRALIAQCDGGEDLSSMVAKGHADIIREKAGL